MTPTISIIMPCYNAERQIAVSIASALEQTYKEIELIVVNDGSEDNSLGVIESVADTRLKVISQSNGGVCKARNRGLRAAQGEYIAFLDADDTWEPRCLEKLIDALIIQPNAVLAYCGWQNVGLPVPRGEPFIPPDYETPAKRETLFAGCRWPIHAALSKREAIIAAGGFDTHLKNAEDYALWLEVAGTTPIVRVPEVLAFYHFHGNSQASGNHARAALHLLTAQKNYLTRHPDFARQLGQECQRNVLYGNLLKQGYENYWIRDLQSARIIFRRVMRAGYGRAKDWVYMLPALLPISIHELLIRILQKNSKKSSRNPAS